MPSLTNVNAPQEIRIPCGSTWLPGDLVLPTEFIGIVLFAQGGGSGRHDAHNRHLAVRLQQSGIATLLFDLLTAEEAQVDLHTGKHARDTALLTRRMELATAWSSGQPALRGMPIGLFGTGLGSSAALIAAAHLGGRIAAVVSHGGRPDLAGSAALQAVAAPTLLVASERDAGPLGASEQAMDAMRCVKRLAVIPRTGALADEAAAMQQVGSLAAAWFGRHLLRTEQLA